MTNTIDNLFNALAPTLPLEAVTRAEVKTTYKQGFIEVRLGHTLIGRFRPDDTPSEESSLLTIVEEHYGNKMGWFYSISAMITLSHIPNPRSPWKRYDLLITATNYHHPDYIED